MQPTEEQAMKLWEWCGFRHIPAEYCEHCKRWEGEYWIKEGIGRRIYRPELLTIDLNSLFKYASIHFTSMACGSLNEPNWKGAWAKAIPHEGEPQHIWEEGLLPEVALFWAIWKVIPKENKE